MGEPLFKPLIESLQKNPGQKPNRIRGTKIERALPDSVNRFLQELAHFPDAFQRSARETAFVRLPATASLSSLSPKRGQFFGMRVKEAQPSFHGGRLAYTTSLCLSLTLLPAPLF